MILSMDICDRDRPIFRPWASQEQKLIRSSNDSNVESTRIFPNASRSKCPKHSSTVDRNPRHRPENGPFGNVPPTVCGHGSLQQRQIGLPVVGSQSPITNEASVIIGHARNHLANAAEQSLLTNFSYNNILLQQMIGEKLKKADQQKKQRPKKFQCPHCRVSFTNNGQLKGHIRIHTGKWSSPNIIIASRDYFTKNVQNLSIQEIICTFFFLFTVVCLLGKNDLQWMDINDILSMIHLKKGNCKSKDSTRQW